MNEAQIRNYKSKLTNSFAHKYKLDKYRKAKLVSLRAKWLDDEKKLNYRNEYDKIVGYLNTTKSTCETIENEQEKTRIRSNDETGFKLKHLDIKYVLVNH
jgi:hypothetical protein